MAKSKSDSLPEAERLDRLIVTRDVANRFGYTVGGLLDAVRRGQFPPPIKRSKTRYVWSERMLAGYMAKLKDASAAGGDDHAA
ncbi:MAG TPA: hypothetical protein VKA46_29575 [Gemmataceae bacterium]|nr:hypothetical protein [Gemmataceae bacterium]